MLEEAKGIVDLSDESTTKEELREKIESLFQHLNDYNKEELCEAIGEAQDIQEAKKTETSMCASIFKKLLGVLSFAAMVNYILFGPAGFRLPKYQGMKGASTKK